MLCEKSGNPQTYWNSWWGEHHMTIHSRHFTRIQKCQPHAGATGKVRKLRKSFQSNKSSGHHGYFTKYHKFNWPKDQHYNCQSHALGMTWLNVKGQCSVFLLSRGKTGYSPFKLKNKKLQLLYCQYYKLPILMRPQHTYCNIQKEQRRKDIFLVNKRRLWIHSRKS